eukprot:TRINITY_DN12660_c0_g1_i1.p1 TRINITY_DN12660_c0_g1~~TRINITY_DN12660_c0_g1_i1.p1  ORF type:complete len:1105 (+),score=201.25 TRINITY_DN12660_c0_g1_i1:36-3350(+)
MDNEESLKEYRTVRDKMPLAARMSVQDILLNNKPLKDSWASPIRKKPVRRKELEPIKSNRASPVSGDSQFSSEGSQSPLGRGRLNGEHAVPATSEELYHSEASTPALAPSSIPVGLISTPTGLKYQPPPLPSEMYSRTREEDLMYIKQLTMQSDLFLDEIQSHKDTIHKLEEEALVMEDYSNERQQLLSAVKRLETAIVDRDATVLSLHGQLKSVRSDNATLSELYENLERQVADLRDRNAELEKISADQEARAVSLLESENVESEPFLDPMAFLNLSRTRSEDLRKKKLLEKAPTGEVTLAFTDIQGSTRIWEAAPAIMSRALQMHNELVRDAIDAFDGYEVKTLGDAFMVAFASAAQAVKFSLHLQMQLLNLEWPEELDDLPECPTTHLGITGTKLEDPTVEEEDLMFLWRGLKVRIGINKGEPLCKVDPCTSRMDYLGPMVNKTARVESQALGGMIAVTKEVIDDVQPVLNELGFPSICSHNVVQLKGIAGGVEIFRMTPRCLKERFEQLQQGKKIDGVKEVSSDDEDDVDEEMATADEMLANAPSGEVFIVAVKLATDEMETAFAKAEWEEAQKIYFNVLKNTGEQVGVPYQWFGGTGRGDMQINEIGVLVFKKCDAALEWCLKVQERLCSAVWPECCEAFEGTKKKYWNGKLVSYGLAPQIAIFKTPDTTPTIDPFRKTVMYFPDHVATPSFLASLARPGQILASQNVIDEVPVCTSTTMSFMGTLESPELPECSPCVTVHQMYPRGIFERMYLAMGFTDDRTTRNKSKFKQFKRTVEMEEVKRLSPETCGNEERKVLDIIMKSFKSMGRAKAKQMETLEKLRMGLEDSLPSSEIFREARAHVTVRDLLQVVKNLLQDAQDTIDGKVANALQKQNKLALLTSEQLQTVHQYTRGFTGLVQNILDDTVSCTKEEEKQLPWLKGVPGKYKILVDETGAEGEELVASVVGHFKSAVSQAKHWRKFYKGTASPTRRGSGFGVKKVPSVSLRGVFARLTQDVERRYDKSQSPERQRPGERRPSVPTSNRSISPTKLRGPERSPQPKVVKRWGIGPQAASRISNKKATLHDLEERDFPTVEGNSSPIHKPTRSPSIMRTPMNLRL